jgi:hypothetical protein
VYKNQQGRQEEFFFLFIHQQVIIYHHIKKKSSVHILQQEFYIWHLLEFFLNKSFAVSWEGDRPEFEEFRMVLRRLFSSNNGRL